MELDNLTDCDLGPTRRRYDDACAATHAMNILGDRWAVPVMRELMLGPRRFGELRAGMPGISANVLTQRLQSLEEAGVLRRRKLPPPASVQVYELTRWGHEAGPILRAMVRWAVCSPTHDLSLPFSPTSLLLSMRIMLDPVAAGDLCATLAFRFGEEGYTLRIGGGEAVPERGPAEDAQALFTGTTVALAAVLYRGRSLAQAEEQGDLTVQGDRALAQRFVRLFPLPPQAG